MATNVPDFGTEPEMEPEDVDFFDEAKAAAATKTEDATATADKEARRIIGVSPFETLSRTFWDFHNPNLRSQVHVGKNFRTKNHSAADTQLRRRIFMQRLHVGQKICSGRFVIQSLLGIGGSGEVYLAQEISEGKEKLVALKVFSEFSSGETPLLELHTRIHREAEALAKIKHQAIVQAFEVINSAEMTILVQEYLTGGSLQEAIRRDPKELRKPNVWLNLALALAEGLDVVHTAGLSHGDIKPGNIGFRDLAQSHPVYLDFGQAALVNSGDFLTRSAKAMATL
ncbi:hypothetical protein EBR21_08640, partial [bacterium]|nr:hypothetical protein [bacterium]